MFTQNVPASRMPGHDEELLPAQKPTSGGSSETEKNEPTAKPAGLPLRAGGRDDGDPGREVAEDLTEVRGVDGGHGRGT